MSGLPASGLSGLSGLSGRDGWGYAGTPVIRPIGITPRLKVDGEGWHRGEEWPPAGTAYGRIDLEDYPISTWGPEYLCIAVLSEFVKDDRWRNINVPAVPQPGSQEADDEFEELSEIAQYRAGVLAEATAQHHFFLDYFRGILGFNPASHPRTFALAWAALRIGQFEAMRHKLEKKRPRPSMVYPSLMPPIDPPPHPSFPSGHATEARLIALCLAKVMPEGSEAPLLALAKRIARNREVIGLHYRSDTTAGEKLADDIAPLLLECPIVRDLVKEARLEWGWPPDPP